ncbi:hypothetical protein VOLCADRAFT_120994 [Volvox carteri f. nagariensis]|uniref:RNA helicase n=1 Tax=Volvox carteri f. nagariensis TaxID=3068 RepID=D8TZ91_VOLCA|nr:uncharacterized protein VOLCADRAFT_120994 [Volvox carteri f. nagariensis]EFJ47234.1 hypothetical protein VOLCADRAFT_120994 [Volvox carteri f. nagariensis]|eukprot:XP_002951783.1 hypothetical protein VOLCADRAFT_120994 [Volvox carteri f. nagariensis]
MTKTSKRQQKNKHVQSLRSKAGGSTSGQASGLDLLSDELKQQYEESGIDPSQLIVAQSSKAKGAKQGGAANGSGRQAPSATQELSKSQLRKLKQIQQKKERRENLAQVLAQLHTHAASDTALALMRPLHQRGHRETKKQRLRRELQLQRAGLEGEQLAEVLGATGGGGGGGGVSELLRQRTVKGAVAGASSDSDEEDEEDEEEGRGASEQRKPPAAASAVHAAAVRQGPSGDVKSDDNDSSEGDREEGEEEREPQGKRGPAAKKRRQDGGNGGGSDAADPAAAGRAALLAARLEAKRIRAQELGGVVPVVQDEQLRDPEVAAARRQAAAAAAAASQFPHRVVHVSRPAALAAARLELPISGMEADIMEAVAAHDVVVLAGETGCGKTTQVPQFLLEAGYGCRDFPEKAGAVGITQPRRVAAVSTAQRVAEELGCGIGEMFMTDGILLRELQLDFLLRGYSAIVVDEAHERALNTDLLLGEQLASCASLRRRMWRERQEALARGERPTGQVVYPLKLVIMSATLRTSDFTDNKRLFAMPPPVINVPARQYPVTVHFSRRTAMGDYVSAAFRKVTRIHAELPPGGILVFLTGQREVEQLCKRLNAHYSARGRRAAAAAAAGGGGGGGGNEDADGDGDREEDGDLAAAAPEQYGGGGDAAEVAGDAAERRRRGGGGDDDVDDYGELNGGGEEGEEEDEEEVQVLGGDQFTPEEIAAAERRFEEEYGKSLAAPSAAAAGGGGSGGGGAAGRDGPQGGSAPVYVLPLYAMLPQARQAKVFAPHPQGHRLIIVATNVAETSLTIPGIRYVVDAGRSKQKLLEDSSGGQVARYEVHWISKASAAQRAGRAGRTCPGHTYRLYSSAHFNDTFPEHSPPEIVNTSLEGVVLVMKSMGVDKVHNFPFPTPPDPEALRAAHRCLEALCALSPGDGQLTDIGRAMAAFPISPRHARMLLEVLNWHKKAVGGVTADGDDRYGTGGALSVPEKVARRAGRALPYAVALAAAISIESPFVHIDTVGAPASTDPSANADGDVRFNGGGDGDAAAAGRKGPNGAKRRKKQAVPESNGKRQDSTVVRKRKGDGGDGEEEDEERNDDDGEGNCDGGEEDDEDEGDGPGGRRRSGGAGPGPASEAAAAAREAARRRRQHAAAMQARFRHAQSDALSAVAALVAFEASGESEDFASAHFLHARNLREAADLHRQLLRVLAMQQVGATPLTATAAPSAAGGSTLSEELAAAAKELAAALALPGAAAAHGGGGGGSPAAAGGSVAAVLPEGIAAVLRRALAAGWADQVARRVRSSEYLAQLGESRRKHHAVRYQPACLADEHVFLHPRSALHGDVPELLVYMQLLRTEKRSYMTGLTAIEPEWLAESGTPLCALSATPLTDPPPSYRGPPVDAVLAWREARYGMHGWALPPVAAPHPDASERAAGFAAALLEGRVLPAMTEVRPHLAASPAMLLRPELRGVARVGELVGALVRARVDSRRSLAAAWRSQPELLQREVAAWLPKTQQPVLLRLWPRLREQAAATAAAALYGFLLRDLENKEYAEFSHTVSLLGKLLFDCVRIGGTCPSLAVSLTAEQLAIKLLRMGTLRCYCRLVSAYADKIMQQEHSVDVVHTETLDSMGELLNTCARFAAFDATNPTNPTRRRFCDLLRLELRETQAIEHFARGVVLLMGKCPHSTIANIAPTRQAFGCINSCAQLVEGGTSAMLQEQGVLPENMTRILEHTPASYELMQGPGLQFLVLAQAVTALAAAGYGGGRDDTASGASGDGAFGPSSGSDRSNYGTYGLPAAVAESMPVVSCAPLTAWLGARDGSIRSPEDMLPSMRPDSGTQRYGVLELHEEVLIEALQVLEAAFALAGSRQSSLVAAAAPGAEGAGPGGGGAAAAAATAGGTANRLRWSCVVGPRAAYQLCMRMVELSVASASVREEKEDGGAAATGQSPSEARFVLQRDAVWHVGVRALATSKSLLMGPLAGPVAKPGSAHVATEAEARTGHVSALTAEWWRAVARVLQMKTPAADLCLGVSLSTSLHQMLETVLSIPVEGGFSGDRPLQPPPAFFTALSGGILPALEACLRYHASRGPQDGTCAVFVHIFMQASLRDYEQFGLTAPATGPGSPDSVNMNTRMHPSRFFEAVLSFGPPHQVAPLVVTLRKLLVRQVVEAEELITRFGLGMNNELAAAYITSSCKMRRLACILMQSLHGMEAWKMLQEEGESGDEDGEGHRGGHSRDGSRNASGGDGDGGEKKDASPEDTAAAAAPTVTAAAETAKQQSADLQRPEVQQWVRMASYTVHSWLPALVHSALKAFQVLKLDRDFVRIASEVLRLLPGLLFTDCPLGTRADHVVFDEAGCSCGSGSATIVLKPSELSSPTGWRALLLREMGVFRLLEHVLGQLCCPGRLRCFSSSRHKEKEGEDGKHDEHDGGDEACEPCYWEFCELSLDALLTVALAAPDDLQARFREAEEAVEYFDGKGGELACRCEVCARRGQASRSHGTAATAAKPTKTAGLGGCSFSKTIWGSPSLGIIVTLAAKSGRGGLEKYARGIVVALCQLRRNERRQFMRQITTLANMRRFALCCPKRAWLRPPAEVMTMSVGKGKGKEVVGEAGKVLLPPRFCNNPQCTNFDGPSEADLGFSACGGCRSVSYCCRACQQQHWRAGHKEVCTRMRGQV